MRFRREKPSKSKEFGAPSQNHYYPHPNTPAFETVVDQWCFLILQFLQRLFSSITLIPLLCANITLNGVNPVSINNATVVRHQPYNKQMTCFTSKHHLTAGKCHYNQHFVSCVSACGYYVM